MIPTAINVWIEATGDLFLGLMSYHLDYHGLLFTVSS
jgi:hypothetical protein